MLKSSSYRFILIDEFGDSIRKFASKTEATPYLTAGMRLEPLPRQPKVNPYELAALTLKESPF